MKCREVLGRRALQWAVLMAGVLGLVPAMGAQNAAQDVRAARLSNVEGQVKIVQEGRTLADSAVANTPLFEGTQVIAAERGRAELQLDDGSIVRVTPNSSLRLTALRTRNGAPETIIELENGLAYFEIEEQKTADAFRVQFARSVVTPTGFTALRVKMDAPPGELAVFSGSAHLEQGMPQNGSTPRGGVLTLDLREGQSVVLNGTDPFRYELSPTIPADSWDDWNADRDQDLANGDEARTDTAGDGAESNTPAWTDLDANGTWYDVPGQGRIWSPNEAMNAGWDPYGVGYWMWLPRFGYIWVSGESWGYLPYQCGVWNYYDGFGWGWAPGSCRPWWGGNVFVVNLGRIPGGYVPPNKPHLPRPSPPGGIHRPGPKPMISVNRPPAAGTSQMVVRGRNTPATIGGQTVQPLRPVAPRSSYNSSSTSAGSQSPQSGSQAGRRSGRSGFPGSVRPGGVTPGAAGSVPSRSGIARRPGAMPSAVKPPTAAAPAQPSTVKK
jgi:hypothetical protein